MPKNLVIQSGFPFFGQTAGLEIVVIFFGTTDHLNQSKIIQILQIIDLVLVKSKYPRPFDFLKQADMLTAKSVIHKNLHTKKVKE